MCWYTNACHGHTARHACMWLPKAAAAAAASSVTPLQHVVDSKARPK